MKRVLALILMLAMCVTLVLPFATLTAGAATATASNLPTHGTQLWKDTFGTDAANTSAALTQLNKTTDTFGYANWSVVSGSSDAALTISGGALKVNAASDLRVQMFEGDAWDSFAKENDFTLSFDMTFTGGDKSDYMTIWLARTSDTNLMEIQLRLPGNGYMVAKSDGTSYSLEDDALKATAAEVAGGTTSYGHLLMSLKKTSGGDTLLSRLGISDTYSSSVTALMNQKLSFRLESIHGAGLTLAINGIVVTTTVKNVYYYDLLLGKDATLGLFFTAGTTATLDNIELTAGGAYTITTNDLGLKVMDVNALFSSNSHYSMHWIVDSEGRLRMDALLSVIELQDPDIIGWQERSYQIPGTSNSENTIVETLSKMGYGIVNNKTWLNQPDMLTGAQSRYDSYNWQPIFYKTSKFIKMNDSNREDEFIKGGSTSLISSVTSGNLLFDQAHRDSYISAFSTDKIYNVQLLIGAQQDSLPSGTKAVTVRYLGRMYVGTNMPQKTATELHYTTTLPTEQKPVTLSSTSGWLDVTSFSDTELAAVTYDSSTGMVVYDGTSYTGAYYRRYAVDEVIAVMLTTKYTHTDSETGVTTTTERYNPDSSQYRIFYAGLNGAESYFGTATTQSTAFPLGFTTKQVSELRVKGDVYEHTDFNPITLTEAQMQETTDGNPSYLNVTFFTQEEFDKIEMLGDGTTCTYNGVEYKGMYHVRARMEATIGQNDSKGLTWSVLKMRDGGQEILIMNVHCALLLASQNYLSDGYYNWTDAANWRQDNARQIIETYNKIVAKHGALPTILTGDFNMQNNDPMYSMLLGEFQDSARLAPGVVYWEYSHHEPTLVLTEKGTYTANGKTLTEYYYNQGDITHLTYPDPNYPIDHIFVSPYDFDVTRYNVLNDTRDELLMTDHCALVVELAFNTVFKPVCSHKSGIYSDLQTVTLTPAQSGDTIYYTTDGSDPSQEDNSARRIYTKAIRLCGDVQLKFVSCRDGVYSPVGIVNFSVCADIAITEVICNPKGADGAGPDIQEGFEIVNVSNHAIDLADYTFWCQQATDKTMLEDGNLFYSVDMGHLRTQERGKYIMQPGDVFFLWTIMADSYQYEFQYAKGATAYAVEFVTAEKLADPSLRESDWEALGYTGLTEDSIGKIIYRTDLIADYYNKYTYRGKQSPIDASHIVPLEGTSAAGIYKSVTVDGKTTWEIVEARKDVALNNDGTAKGVTSLSNRFNMGNSSYSRLFVTYADAVTAEEYITTAYLDDAHGAASGFTVNATTGVPSVKEGSFTMQPTLDTATGRVTSYATAFNANAAYTYSASWCSIGSLNNTTTAAQKQDVSTFVEQMPVDYYKVTVETGDPTTAVEEMVETGGSFTLPTTVPVGTGVFFGWESSTGKLYAPGAAVSITGEISFQPLHIVFATLPGASMRTTSGSVGMRFSTTVDRTGYYHLATLLGGESKVQKGTFIAPEAYVERAGGFDVSAFPMYLDVQATGFRVEDTVNGTMTLAGSIANILEQNYRLSFAGCGYFAFTYADGSEALIYAAYPESGSRTIVNVAAQAYNDRSLVEDEKYMYYCEADNNYSPYSASRLARMLPFLSDVCLVDFHIAETAGSAWGEEDYVVQLIGSSAHIEAVCSYDPTADAVIIIRTDGESWTLTDVFVAGELADFEVDGTRLIAYLDRYTPEY